jgi:hypothetical protein
MANKRNGEESFLAAKSGGEAALAGKANKHEIRVIHTLRQNLEEGEDGIERIWFGIAARTAPAPANPGKNLRLGRIACRCRTAIMCRAL